MLGKGGDFRLKVLLESGEVQEVESLMISEGLGLQLPTLLLRFRTEFDKLPDLSQGKEVLVQLGDEDLEKKFHFKIVGHEFQLSTQDLTVSVAGMVQPDFIVRSRGRAFPSKTSIDVLTAVLSDYFDVKNEAKTTSDRMNWIQLALESDREFALRVWKRSYYPDDNLLLPFLLADGTALLIDAKAAAKKKSADIGDLSDGLYEDLGGFSAISARNPAFEYLGTFRVYSRELKEATSGTYKPDYQSIFSLGDPSDALKESFYRYQVWFKGVTHDHYAEAMAKNAEAIAKIESLRISIQMRASKMKELIEPGSVVELRLAQRKGSPSAIKEFSGRYLVCDRIFLLSKGAPFTQILGIVKDTYAL